MSEKVEAQSAPVGATQEERSSNANWWLALFVAVPIIGLFSYWGDKPSGSKATDYDYIELHKGRIKALLKDPGSAEFQNTFVSRKLGGPVVCGEVNAKNSFGGYTGFQRFVSGGTVQALESQMKAGEMDETWSQVCR